MDAFLGLEPVGDEHEGPVGEEATQEGAEERLGAGGNPGQRNGAAGGGDGRAERVDDGR